MDLKVNIGFLEGKSNWATWKYKVLILLRSIPGGEDVVKGKLIKPAEDLVNNTEEDQVKQYQSKLEFFNNADTKALLFLTANMTEETLIKVMRFSSAREVWLELNRLYEGVTEDKAYTLCMEFFNYKFNSNDDMANHLSKLKNIWNSLNIELNEGNKIDKLPDILLICKILETLPPDYFSFKASWQLMAKSERTVDHLTTQLCSHERALRVTSSSIDEDRDQETLSLTKSKSKPKQGKSKTKFVCHYCKKEGHIIKNCIKWKKDGKPPKPKPECLEVGTSSMQMCTSNIFSVQCDNQHWFVDNGATNHVCNNESLFKSIKPFDIPNSVITANGQSVDAFGYGDIDVRIYENGSYRDITLTNVWFVPSMNKNLFSVLSAHDKRPNSKFISSVNKCRFEVNGRIILTGEREQHSGLYKLNVVNVPNQLSIVNMVTNPAKTLQIYHERMAHQDKRHVKNVIERELGIKVTVDSEICEGCIFGKAHRHKFGRRERATMPGEVIHADVCGPFQISFGKNRYYVLFKDDFTRFRFIYFIKEKSEVYEKLELVIKECERAGHNIKAFQSDNGGEFNNSQIKKLLNKHGIQQLLTPPYCSELNGFIEKDNRTVVEAARSLLHSHGNLPQALWGEMTNSAVYILNRTGKSGDPEKSPFEIWFNKKPTIKYLRIIGSECFVHIPKPKRKKMDKKAVKGILVGYDHFGYRVWTGGSKMLRSRDVIFNEQPLNADTTTICLPKEDENNIKENYDKIPDNDRQDDESKVDNNKPEEDKCENSLRMKLRNRESILRPQRYNEFVSLVMTGTSNTPTTYEEAIGSEDAKNWRTAMETELKALEENKTWELQVLPENKKALPCKWVYKIKENPDGTVERYKARLVVKGFSQQKGIDYNETFSPVARMTTIRVILSVAATQKMNLAQFDVSTAFLYGKLEENEELYVRQPKGFEDGSSKVCKLRKSLYGLKQAARCWNKRIIDFMGKLGFTQSIADPCLFIRRERDDQILVVLYVDDGLVASTNKKHLTEFLESLKKEFKIKEKALSYFLGIEINQNDDGSIEIHQQNYIKRILERFGMKDCKSVTTPMLSGTSQEICEAGRDTKEFPYRQAVGALMYLMVCTRPDIAYAVGVVSRKLENPSFEDVTRVKRIFRYLKGAGDLYITYNPNSRITLEGFSDADLGGDIDTGRSTTGVICLHDGGPISWVSQRQQSVALSTTEAELVAASEAARELIWLRRLLKELQCLQEMPTLYVDNEAAIKLAKNPEFHKRTKHIRIRHFFVREVFQEGLINIQPIATEHQLADMLTKPLHKPKLTLHLDKIGLRNK